MIRVSHPWDIVEYLFVYITLTNFGAGKCLYRSHPLYVGQTPTNTIMLLRHLFLYVLVIACAACNSHSTTTESTQSKPPGPVQPGIDTVDRDFHLFIEKFSKDSAFQLNRTVFPLQIRQYDIDNGGDNIIYEQRSAFEMIDFRKKISDGIHDRWKQNIVWDKNDTRATIEIRGIDNGIKVDYHFEKKDGRWMLVHIDDAST